MSVATLRESGLGPKLEAVLARLCQKLGSLYKTQAVKLPYLVDVIATHDFGRRVTEATFEAWKQGVVAREAYVGVTYPVPGTPFAIEQPEYDEGWTIRLAGEVPDILVPQELEIVDFVAEKYGRLSVAELGALTKALNPEISLESWGSNTRAAVNEDAYARLSETWQSLWIQLPSLDLTDSSLWSEPIEDADEYCKVLFSV